MVPRGMLSVLDIALMLMPLEYIFSAFLLVFWDMVIEGV